LSEQGLLDAGRRRFNRWALAPSLIILFAIACRRSICWRRALRRFN
jgi:hypothetical protein